MAFLFHEIIFIEPLCKRNSTLVRNVLINVRKWRRQAEARDGEHEWVSIITDVELCILRNDGKSNESRSIVPTFVE